MSESHLKNAQGWDFHLVKAIGPSILGWQQHAGFFLNFVAAADPLPLPSEEDVDTAPLLRASVGHLNMKEKSRIDRQVGRYNAVTDVGTVWKKSDGYSAGLSCTSVGLVPHCLSSLTIVNTVLAVSPTRTSLEDALTIGPQRVCWKEWNSYYWFHSFCFSNKKNTETYL